MGSRRCLAFLTCLVASVVCQVARADEPRHARLVVDARGALNVSFAGGWTAWTAPTGDGLYGLFLRSPRGRVSAAAVPRFGAPPDPSVGTVGPGPRHLVVVFSRCASTSATRGCDVYSYDIHSKTYAKFPGASSARYSETAPSINANTLAFVRRGATTGDGLYALTLARPRPWRIATSIALETANNGSRVAYSTNTPTGRTLTIVALSGHGPRRVTVTPPGADAPRSLGLTRYEAVWLQGQRVMSTSRISGVGASRRIVVHEGLRIPGAVSLSIGYLASRARFSDAAGIWQPAGSLLRPP